MFEALCAVDAPNHVAAKLKLRQAYFKFMGVKQHPTSVIGSSLMDSNNNPHSNSLEERTFKRLLSLKMPETAHMSITELLEMPNYRLKWLVDQITDSSKSDTRKIDKELARQLREVK